MLSITSAARSSAALRSKPDPNQAGFVTIEFITAVAFSFLVLVMVANLVLVQYGRGVVRAAADEGARAGARVSADPILVCTQRAEQVLDGIGSLGENVATECGIADGQVQAVTTASFEGWLPFIPTLEETSTAIAVLEVEPQ